MSRQRRAVAEATPPATKAPPSGPRPGGRPPRGKGNRPPRDKQQAENAEVDRGLDAEARARRGSGPKSLVPVPNRRQRSDELEAEIAAALGGMSLDDIVAGPAKGAAERLENESRHRAQVVDVHGDDVFFTLGGKNQGVASLRSFTSPSEKSRRRRSAT